MIVVPRLIYREQKSVITILLVYSYSEDMGCSFGEVTLGFNKIIAKLLRQLLLLYALFMVTP